MSDTAVRHRIGDAQHPEDVARALRGLEMPAQEIAAALQAGRPETFRRYMELHRERLEERLAVKVRALADLEQLLVTRSSSV